MADKREPLIGVHDDETPAEVVNKFHRTADVDTGIKAQHHTLGARRHQASPGDHIHDGGSSKKIGDGQTNTLTGISGPTTVGQVDSTLDSLITILMKYIDINDTRS